MGARRGERAGSPRDPLASLALTCHDSLRPEAGVASLSCLSGSIPCTVKAIEHVGSGALLKIDRKRSAAVHRLDMRSHCRSHTFDVVRRHSFENLLMLGDGDLGVRDTGLSEQAEALTKYRKRAQGFQ